MLILKFPFLPFNPHNNLIFTIKENFKIMITGIKNVLLFLVLLITQVTTCSAQSVLGIKFGSSYDYVKSRLEERFGITSVLAKEGGLHVFGLSMGDISFSKGEFNFQRDDKNSYFNSAEFWKIYKSDEQKAAEADVDALYSLLKQKYGDKCGALNTGTFLRCYWFGENPQKSGEWLGSVVLTKGDANDGVPRLYLWLKYGPIYYIDKASDF